jgi:hypothetical protein
MGTKSLSLQARRWAALTLLATIVVVGAALLTYVYHWAQSAPPHYDLFWVGMACMFVPLWLITLSSWFSEPTVLVSIVLIGLCSYFPAFLRAPSRPVFSDALGHYLSVENTLRTGNLFAPNPVVPMAAYYPGLHTLTAALVKLSGAPIWDVAVVLLALFHVSTLLGIYSITMALSESSRAPAVAATIYGLSPQFGFFDSQFAYESLAVPLLVWTVALLLYARKSDDTRWSRVLLSASAILGACCAITHHLTSYVLVAIVILIGLLQLSMGERRGARSSLGIGLVVGLFAIGWVLLTKAPVISYLGYFPRTAVDAIGPILSQLLGTTAATATTSATATRSLFAASSLPLYERYAAFAVQVIAFVATAVAAWRFRLWRSGALFALTLLAFSYFLMLPLRLNLAGEQGSGRVQTFQWIGIAIIIPIGLFARPWRRSVRRHTLKKSQHLRKLHLPHPLSVAIATVVVFVSLVGNYGSSVDAALRFPGAFQLGSGDGRDTPLEAVRLAERFLSAEGPDRRVVTDGATERIFQTYAYTQGLSSFPQWDFFLSDYSSRQLQSLAYSGGINAIVIDDRVVEGGGDFPTLGFPPTSHPPITTAGLDRLSSFSWLRVMYRTTHYTVLAVLATTDNK